MKYPLTRSKALLGLAAAVLFSAAAPSFAGPTPETLNGATKVDAAKAKSLVDGGAKLIDMRSAAEYAEGHAKGAINVPYKEKSAKAVDFDASLDTFDLSKLPADKNMALVAYCNGVECWKSYKGLTAAMKAGYKNTYWLRDGYPGWKAKGYPAE